MLPRCRIQIRKRFIEEENINIIHQNTTHGDALFLPARQCRRRMVEILLHINDPSYLIHSTEHIVLLYTVILQCEGQILRHCKTDELSIRIL